MSPERRLSTAIQLPKTTAVYLVWRVCATVNGLRGTTDFRPALAAEMFNRTCGEVAVQEPSMSSQVTPRPARYPSAQTQFQRLIRLVLLLALMLFSVHWASQGKHWEWLTGPKKPAEPELEKLEIGRPASSPKDARD